MKCKKLYATRLLPGWLLFCFSCVAREREIRMFSLIRTFSCSKKNNGMFEFECFYFHRNSLTKINQRKRWGEWSEASEIFWSEGRKLVWNQSVCRFAFKFVTSVFALFSVTKFTKLKMLFSGKEEESSKVWCSKNVSFFFSPFSDRGLYVLCFVQQCNFSFFPDQCGYPTVTHLR